MSSLDWDAIIENSFIKVREHYQQRFHDADPETISPNEKAILAGLESFPCVIEILDVEVDNQKNPHLEHKISQFVKYDLSKLNSQGVVYCGKISATKDDITNALTDYFKVPINDAVSIAEVLITKEFQHTGFTISNTVFIQFTRYDIRNKPEKFIDDLINLVDHTFWNFIIANFKTEKDIDFNSEFNLVNDTILSSDELLKMDSLLYHTLERHQKLISDIKLISTVPESVQKLFQTAKDLFIFGYFKYQFFTTAIHYALFAFDTAVETRYVQEFKGKATLSHKDMITHDMPNPTYMQLFRHIKEVKRKQQLKSAVLVNNEEFLFSVEKILNEFVKRGIIKKWQSRFLKEIKKLRNNLTHIEDVSTFSLPDSVRLLRHISYDINLLFYKQENNNLLKI